MGSLIQILAFIIVGIILLWFGFTLYLSLPRGEPLFSFKRKNTDAKAKEQGTPGDSRTCPVCSTILERGEKVKSAAFPSLAGYDRLMHISGCVYCLEGDLPRVCPVCKVVLQAEEFLIARLFDKPGRSHVHVLGCNVCKKW